MISIQFSSCDAILCGHLVVCKFFQPSARCQPTRFFCSFWTFNTSSWCTTGNQGVRYSLINIIWCMYQWVEMFLGQKLAERERTGQRSRSKQGLSYPGFFLSIPVLNGLSDRSKPVQGFSHSVFNRFSPVFSLFCLSNPFKKSCEG